MSTQPDNTEVHRLISSLPAAVAVLEGPAHLVRYHNDEYQQLIQADDTIVGLTIAAALPEIVEQGFVSLLDEVYSTGTPYIGTEIEVELERADGPETLHLNFAYIPRRNLAGDVDGIIVHAVDVTEQVAGREHSRALAEELAVERERLGQVIEHVGAGVAFADATGRLLVVNRGWRETFEVPSEEVASIAEIGDYIRFEGHWPDGQRYAPEEFPISRALLHDERIDRERIRFSFPESADKIVDVSATRVAGVPGQPLAAMVTTIDVTDELQTQQQVIDARDADLRRRADAERRRAYEVNDTVVQRLAVADLAFDLGETDEARAALREALAITKQLISEWGARADDLSLHMSTSTDPEGALADAS